MSLPCAKIVVVIVVLVLNIDSVDACKRGIARVVTATTKNAVNAVHSVRNTLSRINGALSGSRSTRLSQRRLFQNSIHRIKSGRISPRYKRLKAPSKSQTSSAGSSKVSTKELSSIDEIDSDVDALIKVSKSSSDPLIEEAPSGFYIRNTVDTAAPGPSTAMKEVKPSTSKAGRPPLSKNKSTMHQNRFKYEI